MPLQQPVGLRPVISSSGQPSGITQGYNQHPLGTGGFFHVIAPVDKGVFHNLFIHNIIRAALPHGIFDLLHGDIIKVIQGFFIPGLLQVFLQ